jgi:gliding motility-associated lipoprotein GldD
MIRLVLLVFFILGCQTPTPKPNAQLALEYPLPNYISLKNICPYQFEYNQNAVLKSLSSCGATLAYNKLNATLYLTYFDLENASLDTLLLDFEKRLEMFGKKAFQMNESTFENLEYKVVGSCVTLIGDSPSNLHFFGTDTQKHYLTGSLLFKAAPNYDSLAPAIAYIKNDVQKLLETLRWD